MEHIEILEKAVKLYTGKNEIKSVQDSESFSFIVYLDNCIEIINIPIDQYISICDSIIESVEGMSDNLDVSKGYTFHECNFTITNDHGDHLIECLIEIDKYSIDKVYFQIDGMNFIASNDLYDKCSEALQNKLRERDFYIDMLSDVDF